MINKEGFESPAITVKELPTGKSIFDRRIPYDLRQDLDKVLPTLRSPSKAIHLREEPEVQYARGGPVKGARHYACKTISCKG